MLLARRGIEIGEAELVRQSTLDEGGLTPAELAALARSQGFAAMEEQIDDGELVGRVAREQFPVVYLYRKVLDGVPTVHAVIPISFSAQFVTFLDPLRGKRRVSRKKFAKARAMVQQWAVVIGEVQGAMALLRTPRPGRLSGEPVVYVDYVGSAPWNIKGAATPPRLLGVGTLLIAEAVRLSLKMGLGGRVGLHSLPQAEAFYRRCGMTRIGPDPGYYDLCYFEFTGQQAVKWLDSIGVTS